MIYVLANEDTWNQDKGLYSFSHRSMRGIEAAVSVFYMADVAPFYENEIELDAFIRYLDFTCCEKSKNALCTFAHQIIRNEKGPNYNLEFDSIEINTFARGKYHLA